MQFTISDIQAMADPRSFQRGVEYFKRGKVRQVDYRPGETHFEAKVSGSGRQTYWAEVYLDDSELYGNCTCPVAVDCKHCVAAALEWQRLYAHRLPMTAAPKAPHSTLAQWLAEIPPAPLAHKPVLEYGHTYTLYFLEEVSGNLRISLNKGYLKKNGEWSRISRYSPDYFTLKYNAPAHILPEDSVILQLLPRESNMGGIELAGEAGRLALTHMLATQRVYFDGRPVQAAPPESLHWDWAEDAEGWQLTPVLADRDNWLLIDTEPPCFLDRDARELGELTTSLDSARAAHLLTMPPVPKQKINEVAVTLRQWFDRDTLPLPVAEPELIIADKPEPCLTLTLVEIGNHAPLPAVLIHFEYAGQRVEPRLYSPAPPPLSEARKAEGKHIQIRRDFNQEEAKLIQASERGLFLFNKMGSLEHAWAPEANTIGEIISFWQGFIEHSLPELEAQGWQIDIAPDFQLSVSKSQFDLSIKDSRNHWFEFALRLPIGDNQTLDTAQVVDMWLQQGAPDQLILEVDGKWLEVDAEPLKPIRDLITELYNRKQLNKPVKLPAFQAAQLQSIPNLDESKAPATRALLKQLKDFRGIEPVTPSTHLQAELRGYQQEGLNWLAFLHRYGLGGILADDMGLGKTLQTLALLQHLKDTGALTKPALIVAPTSLVGNWQHETERFTPQLAITVIHGPERANNFKNMAKSDLVITTYPLLVRDGKRYEKRGFSVVILDEAQAVKNPMTKAAQQVSTLQSQTRLCLTGTPLENHLGELWSLMNFALPGLLGGRETFQKTFRTPIENQGDTDCQKRLAERVAPFMLRRTKQEVVQELPEKTEMVQYVELQGQQRTLYESIRVSMEKRIRELVASQGMARSHIEFLDALLKLRQACIDPRLVKLDKAAKVKEHAKLDWLTENLPQLLEEGRNILVFSQFTQALALIETELKARQIPYSKLTGRTRKRQEAIDEFQQGDTRVFLISLKAGGSGLNLTAADVVIHLDPWWNPAVENQATDRAHRIGQDKPVFVYKLVAADTVEERIQQMQLQKQALADNLFSATGAAGLPQDKEVLLGLLAP